MDFSCRNVAKVGVKEQLTHFKDNRIKIAASYFSIYAFAALKHKLKQIKRLQFIFISPTFVADKVVNKLKKEKREYVIHEPSDKNLQSQFWRENSLYGSKFELHLRNKLIQKAIARAFAD